MRTPSSRTREGAAIHALRAALRALEERTGCWPGADVVDLLSDWLAQFDLPTAPPEPAPARAAAPEKCRELNDAAVFHRPQGEGELPCLEVGGVAAFVYLDPGSGQVRVSVHLESADPMLVQPDGTVRLRVDVGDATVFDSAEDERGKGVTTTKN